jgi:hypothetical protein
MWHQTTKIETLLDSGATHNFVDERMIQTLALGTNQLPEPLLVHNADGTLNKAGTITQFCNLRVRRGKQAATMGFYVTNLGRDWLILGHEWFKTFNSQIDWKRNALLGEEVVIETAGYLNKL